MNLVGLDYALRLPLRLEESLGCPRCHTRLAGSLRCDRCDFEMAWKAGILVCRPEDAGDERGGVARAREDETWGRFVPDRAKLILDYTGGEFAVADWMAHHSGAEVVSLHASRAEVLEAARSTTPAVHILSAWGEVPFADRTVDAVLVRDVDPRLPEWEASAFYREAFRVLRPGGWLVLRSRPVGRLRTLGLFRRRVEREGLRYLGGAAEFRIAEGWWLNMMPREAMEWWLGTRFSVVAGRY